MWYFICLIIGSFFGVLVTSLVNVAKCCDHESEIYSLKSKLNVAEYQARSIAASDAD